MSGITWGTRKIRPRKKQMAEKTPFERLGFEPDARQRRLLESTSQQVILNCCRQWGKSTVTAVRAVLESVDHAGSLALVVSPSSRQSGEFIRKARGLVRKLGMKPKGDGENRLSVVLPNGSRIVGLPESEERTRGFSAVNLLVVDEASRVDESLYLALRPTVAVSGGKVWLMSTPFGKRGFFWEVWTHGGPEWERIRVTAEECPRIPDDFLERERKAAGERWFRQEYLCEFDDLETNVFRRDVLDRAVRSGVEPLEL